MTTEQAKKYKVWIHIEEMTTNELGDEVHEDLYEEEYRLLKVFDSINDANEYIVDMYNQEKGGVQ